MAARPAETEWATAVLPGGGTTYADVAGMDAGVATLDAATITTQLPTSGTVPPGTSALGFRYNTAGFYIQSRPTTANTNAANVLMATLQNDSGSPITSLVIAYDYGISDLQGAGTDELPGLYAYYSLSGAPGSWISIPALSGSDTAGNVTATIDLSATPWSAGSTMYIVWADDNDEGQSDTGRTLDNVVFVPGNVVIPLSVNLTAPTDGQVLAAPADVTITATTAGSTPATSVSFYTNNVLFTTLTAAPFTATLTALPLGTYAIRAEAVNGVDPAAVSTTSTITVREEFVLYNGGTLSENFDGMGTAGTVTPIGWYVGAALPATTLSVTVGDGSAAASGTVNGWNYGTSGDGDRALGTAPTGGDRNMVLRLKNTTTSSMVSFEIHYDGETWRTYTNQLGILTNYVSFDLGTTWIPTTFDYTPVAQSEPGTQGAVNGNDAANRIANIGGIVAAPVPVGPGGVVYVRWNDFNEGGTDGGLAIDNFTFVGTFEQFQPFAVLTAPADGAAFAEGAPITLSAIATMNNPIASVDFLHDGLLIGTDTTSPYSAVYSNATIGTHTLTAIANDTLGNFIIATNTVQITVNPNVPPSLTFTNPEPDLAYLVGTMVSGLSVSAADTDGSIVRVEFYDNGLFRVSDTNSAYSFDLCDITAGDHNIMAVAVDNLGARGTNTFFFVATNPPDISVIVANSQEWKYFDLGTDPGATWNTLGYDDSSWSNGVAELGYGDGPGRPERTVVSFGPSSTAKYAATYFRKKFDVADPNAYTNVVLNVLKDDRCIVYLNGTLVYHDITNVPIDQVTFQTYTPGTLSDDGTVYQVTNLPPSALVAGQNILAVEVHQDAAGSSDISFDLMLWGQAGATVGPKLFIAPGPGAGEITITWTGGGTLQESDAIVGGTWTSVSSTGTFSTSTAGKAQRFYKLIP
ncbi:MAG: Ig-like domain-containing protein [Verrucomicrobia bacterium]|nr:Ig-like domain-containing protein [Verrucomicrobiota bacterium]